MIYLYLGWLFLFGGRPPIIRYIAPEISSKCLHFPEVCQKRWNSPQVHGISERDMPRHAGYFRTRLFRFPFGSLSNGKRITWPILWSKDKELFLMPCLFAAFGICHRSHSPLCSLFQIPKPTKIQVKIGQLILSPLLNLTFSCEQRSDTQPCAIQY